MRFKNNVPKGLIYFVAMSGLGWRIIPRIIPNANPIKILDVN